jgi:hypothetical protein
MYQEFEGVFCSAHNLTTLYLWPSVFIHPLVLDKVASGEFLPFLEKFAVRSVSGWDVVWMMQKRNLASMSGPSSASLVARPVALNYLDLCVMGCGLDEASVQELEYAVGALLLPCGYLFRYIDIRR